MEDMIDETEAGLKEIIQNLMELDNQDDILRYIDQEKNTCTANITLSAYKEDGIWKLYLSDAFINAIMGNMNSEEFSDEIQERLDELEHEYEQELDKW